MKIENSFPPLTVVELIETLDPEYRSRKNIVTTYDGVLYNPSGGDIGPEIIAHEEVHIKQQTDFPGGPLEFVKEFVSNETFRFRQEVEAYKAQLEYEVKHGAALYKVRRRLAAKLLNGVYGVHLTQAGAELVLS